MAGCSYFSFDHFFKYVQNKVDLTDRSNDFKILMSHFGSCTFVFKIKFIINLVSVIGHYFMSQVLNICILPFMPWSRRRNDVFNIDILELYRCMLGDSQRSCRVQWFLWDLRQNLFPSLRLLLTGIVCAGV